MAENAAANAAGTAAGTAAGNAAGNALRTPLHDTHVAMGGRMVEFAGYELPVQYPPGPLAEHNAVRTAAGLFDIDHMGQFVLSGPDANTFLQRMQVYDLDLMEVYEAHYSLMLYADGTVVDDIFLYRLPDRWFIAVNAANRAKDFAWLEAHVEGCDVGLRDVSDETCMLAIQGPASETILQKLTPEKLGRIPARRATHAKLAGVRTLFGRTGYTGEDGFELYFRATHAVEIWNAILEAGRDEGLLACGLAARDSLRFESCMPLYGHEIDAATTPIEARLGWTVSWNCNFHGREALLKQKLEGPPKVLVGLEMVDRAVAREHFPVAVDGVVVGETTSGMKSPTLEKFLAMAYVPPALSKIGTEVDVLVRGQPKRAVVVRRPFYKPRYK
jgi:aminomethyltransferase